MAVPLPDGLDLRRPLLALLATDEPRSGSGLAQALNAAESEIAAGIEQLRALGIDVAAAPQGFRLKEGRRLELLDADAIRAALRQEAAGRLHRLEVLFEVDSTNTRLLGRPGPPAGFADATLAELQNAGRGRQGRRWIAPFGASLALSLGWTFRDALGIDSSLSLAVGVAVCRALGGLGARGIRLKWPNDVWFEDRKLGGVLVETRMGGGTAHVVVGVGLNLHLSAASRRQIGTLAGTLTGPLVDTPGPAALDAACSSPLSRNALAAALLTELLSMLPLFERHGFAAFRDEWRSLDALRGRAARVLLAQDAVEGIARGVDEDGALLLEHSGKIDKFIAGEASLRLIAGEA
jgi:BirA family transcriptional regulator, biotin operon repressor / biotin---[acetyl-CoA-carboxylase] ligase